MRDYSEMLTMLDEAERGPTEEQLLQTPFIDDFWFVVSGLWVVASGYVVEHPILHGQITTSPVIGFDLESRWMRTRSRFYRLGDHIKFEDDAVTIVGAIDPAEALKMVTAMRPNIRSKIS